MLVPSVSYRASRVNLLYSCSEITQGFQLPLDLLDLRQVQYCQVGKMQIASSRNCHWPWETGTFFVCSTATFCLNHLCTVQKIQESWLCPYPAFPMLGLFFSDVAFDLLYLALPLICYRWARNWVKCSCLADYLQVNLTVINYSSTLHFCKLQLSC